MVFDDIIYEREWRSKELGQMKLIEKVDLANSISSVRVEIYRKMTIPSIYAHLEGFFISALKSVVDYINKLQMPTNAISLTLLSLSLKNHYSKIIHDQGFDKRFDLTNNIIVFLNEPFNIDRNLVTAKSNLSSTQMFELIRDFGMNVDIFENVNRKIDKLVHIRNKIAHGESSIKINYSDYENFIDAIIKTFDILIIEIENYISNKRYLRINNK